MKQFLKISIFIPAAVLLFIIDVPQQQAQFPHFQLVSEAHAVFGVRRRSFRRGVVIGSSAAASTEAAAVTYSQPQAAPVQQSAPVEQQSGSGLLPMGKIVYSLPQGCTTMQASGVEYYHCGVNYYRATFQGNKLVYVTSQPN